MSEYSKYCATSTRRALKTSINVSWFSKFQYLALTSANGAILNATESNLIFGNIPELLRIHESLLNELQIVIDELTIGKNRSLGKCFLNHTQREHFGKVCNSCSEIMED